MEGRKKVVFNAVLGCSLGPLEWDNLTKFKITSMKPKHE